MTLFLADSNVLLDVATEDPVWADWSQDKLDAAARLGRVVINPMIYAELSLAYDNIETLDLILAEADIELLELPRAALFLAGRVFRQYRRRGGGRTSILPDFFIGAHAAVEAMTLITRDSRRHAWFPTVLRIAPGT